MSPRRMQAALGQGMQTRVGRRVLLLFLLCALLPITVLGAASYVSVAGALRQQAAERARLTAKRMASALFERLLDLETGLVAAAARLEAGSDAGIDRRFEAVALVTGDSVRVVRGTIRRLPTLTARQHAHLRRGGTILAASADSGLGILLARAVGPRPEASRVLWAAASRQLVDRVLVGEVTAVRPGPYCLVHGGVAHCRDGEGIDHHELAAALGGEPTGSFVWESGQRFLSGYFSLFLDAQFGSEDWRIVYNVPEAEVLAPLRRFRRWFVIAGALALLVVAFVSIGQIRRILHPLAALREATERVARRELDAVVRVESGDEFEALAAAFNDMTGRLRDRFAEADRLTSALRQATDELQERQARLAAILDAASDAVLTVDESGRIETFDHTAERMFGVRADALAGRPLASLFIGGVDAAAEVTGVRADGSMFPAELTRGEAMAGEHTIRSVFVRDISERKRATEERERLEAQLRQAQKLETIGTLAGGIAHDFNNILTPIIGHVELALGEPGAHAVRDDLLEVRRASMRAKELVSQILLFSRRDDASFGPMELAPVVRESLKLLRATLPATIEIRSTIGDDVEPVLGDPTQLHQVLMNLCTNAYHAMREHGGVLEVRLEMAGDHDLATSAGHAVRLTVVDTGVGMDAATLERLYEPFFTTKPAGEGTGLGMSIVHGIVTRHRGAIMVSSAPGAGTTFEVALPAVRRAACSARRASGPVTVQGQGRVLVVDDDPVIARLVARILESAGFDAESTTTPRDVPRRLTAADTPFDLVITDLTMPGMTGIDLASRLHDDHPSLPIILLSGYSELAGPLDMFREVLVKPVTRDVLVGAVTRVLEEGRPAA
ncbi:MAG TPA: ATP-binding protein [Gemmatimonadaceae bacterium]|nr:ATP-binding protein [Gemmatimonadaceae bacterium]